MTTPRFKVSAQYPNIVIAHLSYPACNKKGSHRPGGVELLKIMVDDLQYGAKARNHGLRR